MINSGELDTRVTIKAPPTAQDISGQPTGDYTTVCTVWAKKRDLSGREFIAAQAVQNKVATKFEIRYRTGIEAQMRLTHEGVEYNIEAALDPEGRKESLHLLCSRG